MASLWPRSRHYCRRSMMSANAKKSSIIEGKLWAGEVGLLNTANSQVADRSFVREKPTSVVADAIDRDDSGDVLSNRNHLTTDRRQQIIMQRFLEDFHGFLHEESILQ